MFGINKAINAIRGKFQQVKNSIANRVRGALSSVLPSSAYLVRVDQQGLPEAVGTARGLVVVFSEGNYPREIARALAEDTLVNIRNAVDPISRSGRLRDSFRIEPDGPEGFKITSNLPYAFALLDAGAMNTGNPPVSALLDWMQYKSEFAALDPKERRRAAFAIKGAIKKGTAGRSGGSDIMRLEPVGQRAYDYLGVALRQTLANYASTDITVRSIVQ